jgi:dihydrolipoamide dehydrogenase
MNMHYQLAVIGSGSGGREAALVAAGNGLRVVLIEKETLGGTCLHRGFYSLKALHACAEAAKDRAKSSKFGFEVARFGEQTDVLDQCPKESQRQAHAENKQSIGTGTCRITIWPSVFGRGRQD